MFKRLLLVSIFLLVFGSFAGLAQDEITIFATVGA